MRSSEGNGNPALWANARPVPLAAFVGEGKEGGKELNEGNEDSALDGCKTGFSLSVCAFLHLQKGLHQTSSGCL